jgi:hypothetical protein
MNWREKARSYAERSPIIYERDLKKGLAIESYERLQDLFVEALQSAEESGYARGRASVETMREVDDRKAAEYWRAEYDKLRATTAKGDV